MCAFIHVLPLCDLKDCRPPGLNPSLLCLLHWQVDSLPLIFSNGSVVKNPPSGNAVDASSIPGLGRSPGGRHGNLLQNILAWEIPWTEEPGGLQSRELQRVRHDEQLYSLKITMRVKRAEAGVMLLLPHAFLGNWVF